MHNLIIHSHFGSKLLAARLPITPPTCRWGLWPDCVNMRLGPEKIILLIRWPQSTHRSLTLKGLVKKVYRAFKMFVGVLVRFSSVAL